MDIPVTELIRSRRSVRTYDGTPLSYADRRALAAFVRTPLDPLGIEPTFCLLDAREHGLGSPVVTGTDAYLAAKVATDPDFELGYGYAFEHVCLFAQSLGLGTVILAGTLSRAAFEKAMDLAEDEVLPVVTPLGRPADRMSLRETVMRRGVRADTRRDFGDLFFWQAFGNALDARDAGPFAQALEMVRWAPSATNRQPWRVVVAGPWAHFFEERTLRPGGGVDIQKVDLGIALCHFDLTMRELGHTGRLVREDPQLDVPDNVLYAMSYRLQG